MPAETVIREVRMPRILSLTFALSSISVRQVAGGVWTFSWCGVFSHCILSQPDMYTPSPFTRLGFLCIGGRSVDRAEKYPTYTILSFLLRGCTRDPFSNETDITSVDG